MAFMSYRSGRIPSMPEEEVVLSDAGLRSIQGMHKASFHRMLTTRCQRGIGANTIISTIRSRRLVNRLLIGYNRLGNDGCCALFGFLGSQEGQRHRIQELRIESNQIGDEGLLAIANYLLDNKYLQDLFLQNVGFHITSFTSISMKGIV